MRLALVSLGVLVVAACAPAPQPAPKNGAECRAYSTSKARLKFTSESAQQAYFMLRTCLHVFYETVNITVPIFGLPALCYHIQAVLKQKKDGSGL